VNDDYRSNRFKKGPIFAKDLEKLRDGVRADTLQRTFRGRSLRTSGGQVFMPYATSLGGAQVTEGGQGYKVVVVSGTGTDYIVTVHTGFPFNDVAETQFTGTLELLYTIENDLPVGTQLFAQCFEDPDYNPDADPAPPSEDQYKCYVFENLLGVY
jgi:hypothetical protein